MSGRDRRAFLREVGGLTLAGLFAYPMAPLIAVGRRDVVEIAMRSDARGSRVWFEPVGVLVRPRQTVRWVLAESVHSATAYHPDNDNHALRIPENAAAWDSGILTEPGATFEITLDVQGVYDYYCAPHEQAGMVGRIVVHDGSGPLPAAAFPDPAAYGWRAVPERANEVLASLDAGWK